MKTNTWTIPDKNLIMLRAIKRGNVIRKLCGFPPSNITKNIIKKYS